MCLLRTAMHFHLCASVVEPFRAMWASLLEAFCAQANLYATILHNLRMPSLAEAHAVASSLESISSVLTAALLTVFDSSPSSSPCNNDCQCFSSVIRASKCSTHLDIVPFTHLHRCCLQLDFCSSEREVVAVHDHSHVCHKVEYRWRGSPKFQPEFYMRAATDGVQSPSNLILRRKHYLTFSRSGLDSTQAWYNEIVNYAAPFEEHVIAVRKDSNLHLESQPECGQYGNFLLMCPRALLSDQRCAETRGHNAALFWIEFSRIRMKASTTKR